MCLSVIAFSIFQLQKSWWRELKRILSRHSHYFHANCFRTKEHFFHLTISYYLNNYTNWPIFIHSFDNQLNSYLGNFMWILVSFFFFFFFFFLGYRNVGVICSYHYFLVEHDIVQMKIIIGYNNSLCPLYQFQVV